MNGTAALCRVVTERLARTIHCKSVTVAVGQIGMMASSCSSFTLQCQGRATSLSLCFNVIVHPKLKFHQFTAHHYVDGVSGDIF